METGTLYTTSSQRSRSSILPHLTFPAHQPDMPARAEPGRRRPLAELVDLSAGGAAPEHLLLSNANLPMSNAFVRQ